MGFNPNDMGMAIYLTFACGFNAWLISKAFTSARSNDSSRGKKLLWSAIFGMALLDAPWVWFCFLQCWSNTFTQSGALWHKDDENSFGCKFMGFYSTFSQVGMMASHCLVVSYLAKYLSFLKTGKESIYTFNENEEWRQAQKLLAIFAAACLYGSIPLMADGYLYSNGSFCYADFTDKAQGTIILLITLFFYGLAAFLWYSVFSNNPELKGRSFVWCLPLYFFLVWILWIPAAFNGIINGDEIDSPYMIIGGIMGHSSAMVSPLLYGYCLWVFLLNDLEVDSSAKDKKPLEI